jgi:hypothetical protein
MVDLRATGIPGIECDIGAYSAFGSRLMVQRPDACGDSL